MNYFIKEIEKQLFGNLRRKKDRKRKRKRKENVMGKYSKRNGKLHLQKLFL
jgi:hypothetical protein